MTKNITFTGKAKKKKDVTNVIDTIEENFTEIKTCISNLKAILVMH